MKTTDNVISLAGKLAAPVLAQSAADSQMRSMDHLTEILGETAVQSRAIADFTELAGSEANARSLVFGLRNGRRITLVGVMRGRRLCVTTFTPPTQPLGNGSVYLSLLLVADRLAAFRITSPTPQQLQAALGGGMIAIGSRAKIALLQGVLQLRSQGMSWARIAHVQGTPLGPIAARMTVANHDIVTGGLSPSQVSATQTRRLSL